MALDEAAAFAMGEGVRNSKTISTVDVYGCPLLNDISGRGGGGVLCQLGGGGQVEIPPRASIYF